MCNPEMFGKSRKPHLTARKTVGWDHPLLSLCCEVISTWKRHQILCVKARGLAKALRSFSSKTEFDYSKHRLKSISAAAPSLNMQQRAQTRPLFKLDPLTDWLQSYRPQELNDCRTGFLHFSNSLYTTCSGLIVFLILHVHANNKLMIYVTLYKCSSLCFGIHDWGWEQLEVCCNLFTISAEKKNPLFQMDSSK